MGKKSGVPHRDDELGDLTDEQIAGELNRAKVRLSICTSAKQAKSWRKRIHWLESALERRT